MPHIVKKPRPNSISLILSIVALVPIQAPVTPVQIVFLVQPHQIVPWNVLLVVTEFAHQEWNSIVKASHVKLVVEQLLSERFLGSYVPHSENPWKTVKVACVYEFVRYVKSAWGIFDIGKVELIVNTSNENQPMWGNLKYLISRNFSCNPPICFLLTTSPSRCFHTSSSDLISQIHTNNSGIVLVPFGHLS